ncbi:MAG: hypothetical protein RLZZ65_1818 [Bacteroidota bacterium]|jgi:hypothetical protein
MKTICCFFSIFFAWQVNAQSGWFSNLQYKRHFPAEEEWELVKIKGTDSTLIMMKYYFLSDDTLYFREMPSEHIHKIAKSDLQETPNLLGKDYHFSRKSQNLNWSALQPKILLGLSAASLIGVAVDLAQPTPLLSNYQGYATIPVFFILEYFQAKKLDRFRNYYQMAEAQKFTKPEIQLNENKPAQNGSISANYLQNTPKESSNNITYDRYGAPQVSENLSMDLINGCHYEIEAYFFESDGSYYVSIKNQPGYYAVSKADVQTLNGNFNLKGDKEFYSKRNVLSKSKTAKALGIFYGVTGTVFWAATIGIISWNAKAAIYGGLGLGVLPATLIVNKANKKIQHYEIYQKALRLTC